ncbi:MAG: penicillin-binding transpeptidase domain-containing protein, partial [Micrococcales bacterium]|nr:penicillin-binding transpeptidase domain-containing protein [Micrococcales bacterium]
GGESFGFLSVRDALAKSVNTIFAQLNIRVGPQATVDAAVKLGLPANTLGLADNYANVFGTASPRVIDMANAYATLAAGGRRAEPYLVKSMDFVDGSQANWAASPVVQDAVSPQVAADAVEAMTRVVESGSAGGARALGRPAAGKTGTTTENRAVWFDGFTPQAATAVGMYLPDKDGNAQPLQGIGGRSELTGGSYPVAIWTAFMRDLLAGQEVKDFPPRAGIGDGDVRQQEVPVPSAPEPTTSDNPTPSTSSGPSTPRPTWSPTDIRPSDTRSTDTRPTPTEQPRMTPPRTREPEIPAPTAEPPALEPPADGPAANKPEQDRPVANKPPPQPDARAPAPAQAPARALRGQPLATSYVG